jgi:xylitol oxidase
MDEEVRNWAGNVTFGAAALHRPSTVEELRRVVAGATKIRALGSGHSFNALADSPGELVSVAGLPPGVDVDAQARTATVSAGMRYGEIAPHIYAAGWALPNLGSLPHISVAGAISTGTHGSGVGKGNLASAVAALELVTAGGELVTVRRGDAAFDGSVVALGALGIVTRVTLDLVPAVDMQQWVYTDLPWEHVDGELLDSAYSVSLFTDWRGPAVSQVWLKHRVGEFEAPPIWCGARRADVQLHPVPGIDAVSTSQQQGVAGPWYERLPHFRLDFTPSAGDELQSEFFVSRQDARAAIAAVAEVGETVAPVLLISEIRTIAADELWLSPAYRRDSVALHFTWIADGAAVDPVLRKVEEQLAPFDARPHWGKVYTTPPEALRAQYERAEDFGRLIDPVFSNPYLDSVFG